MNKSRNVIVIIFGWLKCKPKDLEKVRFTVSIKYFEI